MAQTLRAQGRDEIGWMAASFHATLSYMQTMAQVAGRLAEGDLTVAVTPRSAQDALGQAFAQMVASLRATFGRAADSAGQLTTAAQALAVAAQHADRPRSRSPAPWARSPATLGSKRRHRPKRPARWNNCGAPLMVWLTARKSKPAR